MSARPNRLDKEKNRSRLAADHLLKRDAQGFTCSFFLFFVVGIGDAGVMMDQKTCPPLCFLERR